jgi:hypothetical protein
VGESFRKRVLMRVMANRGVAMNWLCRLFWHRYRALPALVPSVVTCEKTVWYRHFVCQRRGCRRVKVRVYRLTVRRHDPLGIERSNDGVPAAAGPPAAGRDQQRGAVNRRERSAV